MFEQSLIQPPPAGQRSTALAASLVAQCVVLLGVLAIPLIYNYELPAELWRAAVMLTVPPPPPPPPPAVTPRNVPVRPVEPARFDQVLTAPRSIPDRIEDDQDVLDLAAPLAALASNGVPGGVLGGLPDGVLGMGGLTPGGLAQPKPIRVGGDVQSARILNRVNPTYPLDAIEQLLQGQVQLEAIISPEGSIRELTVLSGHPVLASAAVAAVQQWRYRPTRLNGAAVSVVTMITVNFNLGDMNAKEAKKLVKKVRKTLDQ